MKPLCLHFKCPEFWDPTGVKRKTTTFPCTDHHLKYTATNAQILYRADPA